jgi:quinol monooxygenase YgiN
MALYARQGRLVAKPGQRDALAAILLDDAAGLSAMPGCRTYLVFATDAEPDALLITEVWESAAAHQASLSLPGVAAAIDKARPLLDRAEGAELELLGGAGFE